MDAKTKGGRPSKIPTFIGMLNTAPKGQPVILQASASTPALAYYHRRNLAASGINADVVAPGKSKRVGKGTVTNRSEFFALVGVGNGPARRKGEPVPIKKNIRVNKEVNV